MNDISDPVDSARNALDNALSAGPKIDPSEAGSEASLLKKTEATNDVHCSSKYELSTRCLPMHVRRRVNLRGWSDERWRK